MLRSCGHSIFSHDLAHGDSCSDHPCTGASKLLGDIPYWSQSHQMLDTDNVPVAMPPPLLAPGGPVTLSSLAPTPFSLCFSLSSLK